MCVLPMKAIRFKLRSSRERKLHTIVVSIVKEKYCAFSILSLHGTFWGFIKGQFTQDFPVKFPKKKKKAKCKALIKFTHTNSLTATVHILSTLEGLYVCQGAGPFYTAGYILFRRGGGSD